ncbi:MAG: GNAT family N-acetyltransferase [Clostridia bacterium]|nr:GNAT family N-acetyltransferase [Clostridia bacterium]MBR0351432.1 GNAT family N-acetyltransferase [Clostridia bacterium]
MEIKVANGYIRYSVDDMNENELVIDKVEVIKKKQGTGTELVNMVIEIAEKDNKALTLCAYPQDDSIDLESLISFYEKLGFCVEYNDGSSALMRYMF